MYICFLKDKNMEITESKVTIEFDVLKVLTLIENNQFLDKIFRDGDSKLSYKLLYSMAKKDSINEETIQKLKDVFERIILAKAKLKEEYLNLGGSETDTTDVSVNSKPSRYYGKQKILKDAEANNGELTELDRAMLAINNLRNITAKLRNRGKNDKLNCTNILSESDCRDIIAVVRIVENKVVNILKKK